MTAMADGRSLGHVSSNALRVVAVNFSGEVMNNMSGNLIPTGDVVSVLRHLNGG